MSKLFKAFAEGDLTQWPLDQETACQVVRVQLIRGHEDLLHQFKELKVRSQVVKELANIYIDRQCDDLLQSYKAVKMLGSERGSANLTRRETLRHHIEVRVDEQYPANLHGGEGAIPATILRCVTEHSQS